MSAVLVLLLAGGVLYASYMNVDAPRDALRRIGEAASRLAQSLWQAGRTPGDGAAFSLLNPTPAVPLLVNASNPVPEDYTPRDMVRLSEYCDPAVVTIKERDAEGDRAAVDALMEMLRAAIGEGVSNWQISAGYRSVEAQRQVWNDTELTYIEQGLSGSQAKAATAKYTAIPGASEHHTGLAFDVTVPGESFPLTKQSQWLAEHCWAYGFIIRYTEEKQPITGINAEPWHIRYVGKVHAQAMRENNWCLEEYVASLADR